MSVNTIESELLVDLSKQEQQLLSGGATGVLEAKGDFVYDGRKFPATITVTVKKLPKLPKLPK
jgi:hypothetical protein